MVSGPSGGELALFLGLQDQSCVTASSSKARRRTQPVEGRTTTRRAIAFEREEMCGRKRAIEGRPGFVSEGFITEGTVMMRFIGATGRGEEAGITAKRTWGPFFLGDGRR